MRKRLNKKWRSRGRDIFVACDGDIERCEAKFKQEYGSLTAILLILEILLTLWKFWNSQKISEPPMAAAVNEPIDWDDSDED